MAVQSSAHGAPKQTRPLQAFVCIRGHAMQITNNSPYTWHNLSAEVTDYQTHSTSRPTTCAVIAPYRTQTIPLHLTSMSAHFPGYPSAPVVLRWECRTGKNSSRWYGYVPL